MPLSSPFFYPSEHVVLKVHDQASVLARRDDVVGYSGRLILIRLIAPPSGVTHLKWLN